MSHKVRGLMRRFLRIDRERRRWSEQRTTREENMVRRAGG